MILAYRVLTTILYPLLFLFLYYRKIIKKEDPKRFKEKVLVSHFNIKNKQNSKLIWFHAASIGELKSIIPIIKKLKMGNRNLKFLITTTTLSSGNIAKVELKKFTNVQHRYFPFDVTFLIDKFLHLWSPNRIFLVDSEIWPNLILKAKEHKIPIALINARLTKKSFKKWKMFSSVAKKIFGIFDLCLCSNLETKKYLKSLNLKRVYFKGNIKLISQIKKEGIQNTNKRYLLKRNFWFAASTHKEEDAICLKTHLKLKKEFNNILTIIAPRHIERVTKIKSLSEKFNLRAQLLNKDDKILKTKEIIIINYFGALNHFFKYSKSVFIGKSMIKRLKNEGGQNPIEAAQSNCRVYHGPYVYNFEDIYKILKKHNISKTVKDYIELSNNLILDMKKPRKKINENQNFINNLGKKTLSNTMPLIDNFLNNEFK